jgi:hypothetical protein
MKSRPLPTDSADGLLNSKCTEHADNNDCLPFRRLHTASHCKQRANERRAEQKCVLQNTPVLNNSDRLSTKKMAHTNFIQPMKNHVGPHQNNFGPMKNHHGQNMTNQTSGLPEKCRKSGTQHFRPMKNHAWPHTVPNYPIVNTVHSRKNVPNTQGSTSHAHPRRSQRSKKCNHERNKRADTDDRYLSHLKSLTDPQHQQDIQKDKNIMKTPSIIKKQRNPVSKTSQSPYKSSRVQYLTPALLEQSNIKLLIGEQRLRHQAKLRKHDAIVAVQTQFFTALRNLYTWPMDSLILANIMEVKDFWELQLHNAQNCSYKAETIDPNHHGELRYDIMAEIVNLESIRINDFMQTFQHYHSAMHQEGSIIDEFKCDNEMLKHFDPIQSNVIMDIPPQWIEESRRPPLTWYTFLLPSQFAFSPYEPQDEVTKDRILAPEYYDPSGSNST